MSCRRWTKHDWQENSSCASKTSWIVDMPAYPVFYLTPRIGEVTNLRSWGVDFATFGEFAQKYTLFNDLSMIPMVVQN